MKPAHAAAVKEALATAKGMYWDQCHKIYVLMDDGEVALARDAGVDVAAPDFQTLSSWFDQSCMLRFVAACRSASGGSDFTTLVAQGAE